MKAISKRIVKHVLFWVAYLLFYVSLAHPYRDLSLAQLILLFASSLPLDVSLVYFHIYYLIPKFLLKRRFLSFTLLFLIIALTMVAVKRYLSYFVLQPLFIQNPTPDGFVFWNFGALAFSLVNLYAVVFLAASINLVSIWMETNQNRLQLEAQNKASELELLRMQVNPHFLFNSLNNIHTLIGVDDEKASNALLLLSGIMRYMLHGSVSDKVPLTDEIDYLKNYVGLQVLRFSDPEMIRFSVVGNPEGHLIAPMLLIPFVENAFKHHDKLNKEVPVSILLSIEQAKVNLFVSNAMKQTKAAPFATVGGIGLSNVTRRLELLYPNKHTLLVSNTGAIYEVQLILSFS